MVMVCIRRDWVVVNLDTTQHQYKSGDDLKLQKILISNYKIRVHGRDVMDGERRCKVDASTLWWAMYNKFQQKKDFYHYAIEPKDKIYDKCVELYLKFDYLKQLCKVWAEVIDKRKSQLSGKYVATEVSNMQAQSHQICDQVEARSELTHKQIYAKFLYPEEYKIWLSQRGSGNFTEDMAKEWKAKREGK